MTVTMTGGNGTVRRLAFWSIPLACGVTALKLAAWQVTGSRVITGENATDAGTGVRPPNNFVFGAVHWGYATPAALDQVAPERTFRRVADLFALAPAWAGHAAERTA